MQHQSRKIDARHLSIDSLVSLRACAVSIKRFCAEMRQQDIARAVGVSQASISRWLSQPINEAPDTWGTVRKAKAKKLDRGLSFGQLARLREIVCADQDQLSFGFARWSKRDVQIVVKRAFGLEICGKQASKFLADWGIEDKTPSSQDLEADIVRYLAEHAGDWHKVSAVAKGVDCSMQLANRGLMRLSDSGGCRVEILEEVGSKQRVRKISVYRANVEDSTCQLAELFGMVAVQPVGGRIVRGRDMRD